MQHAHARRASRWHAGIRILPEHAHDSPDPEQPKSLVHVAITDVATTDHLATPLATLFTSCQSRLHVRPEPTTRVAAAPPVWGTRQCAARGLGSKPSLISHEPQTHCLPCSPCNPLSTAQTSPGFMTCSVSAYIRPSQPTLRLPVP